MNHTLIGGACAEPKCALSLLVLAWRAIYYGAPMAKAQIYIDVSSLLRWTGPAVGMMRVEHEVATRAGFGFDDVSLCFYDISTNSYRSLRPRHAKRLVGWRARLQPPIPARVGWKRLLPNRAKLLLLLERWRLTTRNSKTADLMDRLQRLVLSVRAHRFPIDDEHGRLDIVPVDLAIGEPLLLTSNDTVLSLASDWWQKDMAEIARLKKLSGFRMVALCYDIIPLQFPKFFPADDVSLFRSHWEVMFRIADMVLVNAPQIARDIQQFCSTFGHVPPPTTVVPLGSDQPDQRLSTLQLGHHLQPEKFALFVSTIEPRKNHALLLRVWKRLLADGIVQAAQFRLVFVGRRGWLVDDVQAAIDNVEAFSGTVLHLDRVDDSELSTLYACAAFCLYPSFYEGFGLPVIEAMARGKAVLSSNGGALAELTDGLSPDDDEQWYQRIAEWINFPERARDAARKNAVNFKNRPWSIVVNEIISATRTLA